MSVKTPKGRMYEGPVAEEVDRIVGEFQEGLSDGPHDGYEEEMILEGLKTDIFDLVYDFKKEVRQDG